MSVSQGLEYMRGIAHCFRRLNRARRIPIKRATWLTTGQGLVPAKVSVPSRAYSNVDKSARGSSNLTLFDDLVLLGIKRLSESLDKDEARVEALHLLADALNVASVEVFSLKRSAKFQAQLEQGREKYMEYIERRAKGEPAAYIRGWEEFYSMRFSVNKHTLIPRPDSEILVEQAAEMVRTKMNRPVRIVDFGTGTGCLIVSVAKAVGAFFASGVAVDISPDALKVAAENIAFHGFAGSIVTLQSCWDSELRNVTGAAKFDVVLSNPPYIALEEAKMLDSSVKDFEPHGALFGGQDGLSAYRELFPAIQRVIAPGGYAFIEIGYLQANEVIAVASQWTPSLTFVQVVKDYGNRDRCLIFKQS